eukprot:3118231-Pyramimonas_sp.AAC.1
MNSFLPPLFRQLSQRQDRLPADKSVSAEACCPPLPVAGWRASAFRTYGVYTRTSRHLGASALTASERAEASEARLQARHPAALRMSKRSESGRSVAV